MSYSHTSHNLAAAVSPLRSMVWNRPAHQVLGWTPRQVAEFELGKGRRDVVAIEGQYADACRLLGQHNATRNKILRARGKAAAFRRINATRAALRAARARLAIAERAMLDFAAAI